MTERDPVSFNVSVPDPETRRFVREQVKVFFGGTISAYFLALIEMDRDENVTRNRMLERLMAPVEAEQVA